MHVNLVSGASTTQLEERRTGVADDLKLHSSYSDGLTTISFMSSSLEY